MTVFMPQPSARTPSFFTLSRSSCTSRMINLSMILLIFLVDIVQSVSTSTSFTSASSSSWLGGMILVRGGEDKVGEDESHREEEQQTATTPATTTNDDIEILEEKVVYKNWRTIIQRNVRLRNGKIVNFDIVGQKDDADAVLIFAWNTDTKTATLVQEYMPGCNKILVGLAAGMIEPSKHGQDDDAPLRAAQCELEEECHLIGGTWIPLSSGGAATSMDKYTATMVTPFLVVDAHHTTTPRPLDEEEDIEIIRGMTIPEILNLIATGQMTITAGWGCLLAIEKLRELGEYP